MVGVNVLDVVQGKYKKARYLYLEIAKEADDKTR
jgi:hypothetical protein